MSKMAIFIFLRYYLWNLQRYCHYWRGFEWMDHRL